MSSYRLSEQADIDMLGIFVYGVENFGERQAEKYKRGLEGCFELLATQPRMGGWPTNSELGRAATLMAAM